MQAAPALALWDLTRLRHLSMQPSFPRFRNSGNIECHAGKSGKCLSEARVTYHFDVSRIPETWKFPLGITARALNTNKFVILQGRSRCLSSCNERCVGGIFPSPPGYETVGPCHSIEQKSRTNPKIESASCSPGADILFQRHRNHPHAGKSSPTKNRRPN